MEGGRERGGEGVGLKENIDGEKGCLMVWVLYRCTLCFFYEEHDEKMNVLWVCFSGTC